MNIHKPKKKEKLKITRNLEKVDKDINSKPNEPMGRPRSKISKI